MPSQPLETLNQKLFMWHQSENSPIIQSQVANWSSLILFQKLLRCRTVVPLLAPTPMPWVYPLLPSAGRLVFRSL